MPGSLGAAGNRRGQGALARRVRRWRTTCGSTITSTTGGGSGFGDDDLAGGGSDRFIDANVAWGDEGKIRARLQQHWDAGADHVCIQSIAPDGSRKPDEKVLALLAPG